MATAPYLDLMAFARGAELGNTQNWKDAENDVIQRTREAKLAQDEATFGLNFPLAQQGAGLLKEQGAQQMQALQDNMATAKFTAQALQRMTGMSAPQRAAYLSETLREYGQRATPGQVGALMQFGQAQALKAYQANDLEGAERILASLPGVDSSPAMREVAKWSDPAQYMNPEVIAQGGGVVQADGRVLYAGALYEPGRFAMIKQEQARKGALADIPRLTAPMVEQQGAMRRREEFMQSMAPLNEANGLRLFYDAETGQAFRLQLPQVQQAAYPETASTRYPAAQGAPTVGATTPTGAVVGPGASAPIRLQVPPQQQQRAAPATAAQPDWMRWLPGATAAPPLSMLPSATGADPYDWLTQPSIGSAL